MYQITYDLANDTSPVFVQYNKFNFRDMNFTDLVNKIFKKKEVDTQLTLIKQTIQKKAKKHLNENFFFAKDTVTNFGFNNEEKIMEWGKSFGSFTHINSREFHIKGTDIFILMVDECSGISCISIYIFKQINDKWLLQTITQARLKEQIMIKVDNFQEKMLFEISSRQIGELSFETLLQ